MSSKKWAYYNDNDPKICKWAKELIASGLVMDGEVDCRDIREIEPRELDGFIQVHFFCGVLGWPYALRLAGWPEARPAWTGSCPCQPFSVAGKGNGLADERHLWPAFRWLIQECGPPIVFGEQVASKLGREWLSGVRSDLETLGYEVGAADLCAASVGAPHIRQRLFWVANSDCFGLQKSGEESGCSPEPSSSSLRLADSKNPNRRTGIGATQEGVGENRERRRGSSGGCFECGGLGNSVCESSELNHREFSSQKKRICCEGVVNGNLPIGSEYASPSVGFWSESRFIKCKDGKQRRVPACEVKSEVQCLVDGVSSSLVGCRIGCDEKMFPLTTETGGRAHLLRGYGNAIIPALGKKFIESCMEAING